MFWDFPIIKFLGLQKEYDMGKKLEERHFKMKQALLSILTMVYSTAHMAISHDANPSGIPCVCGHV